jgi:DNA-binding GntR family transcriptional regulator
MFDILPLVSAAASTRTNRRPLFQQVRQEILTVLDARYRPGDRLPSEPDLANTYGVSRPTIREVLRSLESDGRVRRVHGVGTFVTQTRPVVSSRFDLDLGVTEAVAAAQQRLGVQILRVSKELAPAPIAERLELESGAPLLWVERIILVNDVPGAHAIDAIPAAVAGSHEYVGGSVYRFLESECGLSLVGGVADVTAVTADRRLARLLGTEPRAALLRIDQVERATDDRPVLYSAEHYLPTVMNLSVRRVRRGGESPAT